MLPCRRSREAGFSPLSNLAGIVSSCGFASLAKGWRTLANGGTGGSAAGKAQTVNVGPPTRGPWGLLLQATRIVPIVFPIAPDPVIR
jgi:hypothetical protein